MRIYFLICAALAFMGALFHTIAFFLGGMEWDSLFFAVVDVGVGFAALAFRRDAEARG